MKETAKSLRLYFILVGLLSAYANGTSLTSSPGLFVLILNGAALVLALGFLYVGAFLPRLLASSILPINVLLGCSAVLSLVRGAIALLAAPAVFVIVVQVVSVLIAVYLYSNVKRLAAEARAPQPVT